MFSLANLYNILTANLLPNVEVCVQYFYTFNSPESFDPDDDIRCVDVFSNPQNLILFYDQEPIVQSIFDQLALKQMYHSYFSTTSNKILANSEHSALKNDILKEYGFLDWYYFCHGFAALDWYRDYRYMPNVEKQFTKVFISLNHLVTKDRSYRLNLVANYIEQGILDQGIVSLPLSDVNGNIKSELFDTHSSLSQEAKKLIYKNVYKLNGPLVADTLYPEGTMSAKLDMNLQQEALWNVVSETVFYHNKLHLTEKIFKPIVARRPFILVTAPGNLAYLKSYGFKTFDRWVDESYDTETDNDRRIQKITQELTRLCAMSPDKLKQMHSEMKEVLDYNFNHFYGDFKQIIVDELVDNFYHCVCQLNNGKPTDQIVPVNPNTLLEVKNRLKQ